MRIGQPVVYVQGESEAPWTSRDLRRHPALVAAVSKDGRLDLVVLPLGYQGIQYRYLVPKYDYEKSVGHGWLPVDHD